MKYKTILRCHENKNTSFTICVGEFRIDHLSTDNSPYLVNTVTDHCRVTVYWEDELYFGLNLNWNYDKGYINVSMKDYVQQYLQKFKHKQTSTPHHVKHTLMSTIYGWWKVQYPTPISEVDPLYCGNFPILLKNWPLHQNRPQQNCFTTIRSKQIHQSKNQHDYGLPCNLY